MDRETIRELMERLNRDAELLAARFQLRYRSLEPERPNVKRRYGVCDSEGHIRIRLRHAVSGRPLKYSSLVNTLCHELAHLRHFNHGERFKAFYLRILEYARAEGIYAPRAQSPVAALASEHSRRAPPRIGVAPRALPEQLGLFG
jgi:predicted metal-dependent hydrolase